MLQSPQLGSSLLILATHQPPDISASYPDVHILRLSDAPAIEDAGAVRFVNILECAERIGRVWRKAGGHGIYESLEADIDITSGSASLPPPNVFRFVSDNTVPQPSNNEPAASSRPPNRLRHRTMSINLKSSGVPLPPADVFQRPFDSILNFLPTGVSDKALLKQSILVTTISRPFLTAMSSPLPYYASPGSVPDAGVRRWRKGKSLDLAYSAPATPSSRSRASLFSGVHTPSNSLPNMGSLMHPPRRAHLVHLIPPTRQPTISRVKLMKGMESFLCSFAYPSLPQMGQADSAGVERAAPFLMHPYALRTVVRYAASSSEDVKLEWTIAELLLSGALDRKGEGKNIPRALISSAKDVTFASSDSHDFMASANLTQPPPSPTFRERQREGAGVWTSDKGFGNEMGVLTPEASPTPNTTMNPIKPPSPMERVFCLPFRISGEKALPTPTGSVESDSSGSTQDDDKNGIIVTPLETKVKFRHSKWRFWKVLFATTASA